MTTPASHLSRAASRRAIANSLALKQGLPVTQAAIDARWAAIVSRLNSSLPSRAPIEAVRTPPAAGSVKPTQGDIDATWASIVADLNKKADPATPARAR